MRFTISWAKAICAAACVFVTGACATQARRNVSFEAASPNALIVLGVASEQRGYTMRFIRIDQNCRTAPGDLGRMFDHRVAWSPTAWRAWNGARHYVVAEFPPGDWVMDDYSYDEGGYKSRSIHLDYQSLAFRARPGQVLYVGDVTLEARRVVFEAPDLAAAQAYLAQYPNVRAAAVEQPLWLTGFGRAFANCQAYPGD